MSATLESQKPVHTIVLDTGAIIRNHPTVSTLLAQSEQIVTVPAIITEIRDASTRTRVETQLMPFLTIRSPNPASIKFVTDFARKTGDLDVLSKPDIQIVALAYELECERNGGDWRLRRNPGQKGMNGKPPVKDDVKPEEEGEAKQEEATETKQQETIEATAEQTTPDASVQQISDDLAQTKINAVENMVSEEPVIQDAQPTETSQAEAEDSGEDSDGGWITPSNLKKHQEKDSSGSTESTQAAQSVLQVATLTTDFAMQNVLLQINLNLLSPTMQRVKHLKTYILRCHACFCTTKEMSKQFCPRCGSPTLTRVACSTTSNGEFKLHLKKNMQWNTRGDRFSIPKPVHGSANGRVQGGGKGHWGNDLILAEDQKEYTRHHDAEKRRKERDLMDEDYLPSILTGDRNSRAGGRMKVGGGRNINSRKR
ncbi:D-site 20S pre-rRNA nuclease [Aureobasidium sp. EXF-10727]|nr:D-site 20S pre-rRNA nuclease [Aureobasidium sp. EXF-10727]